MLSKFLIKFLIFSSAILFFSGCKADEHDVKYSVILSQQVDFSAKIIFQGAKKDEQILPDETLPWNYNFTGKEGEIVKVSAYVYSKGNVDFIGTDTLRVTIFINGSKYKEAYGIVNNGVSDTVTISGSIPK